MLLHYIKITGSHSPGRLSALRFYAGYHGNGICGQKGIWRVFKSGSVPLLQLVTIINHGFGQCQSFRFQIQRNPEYQKNSHLERFICGTSVKNGALF